MRITVSKNIAGILAAATPAQRKQVTLATSMRFKGVMERYVPMRSSALRRSADLNSRYDAGEIVYSTPYARRQYNLITGNRTTPGTDGKWDEKAEAEHGDDIAEFAKAMIVRTMNS